MKVTLSEQIAAVETEFVNLRGHIEIIEDLIKKKKRPEGELSFKKARLNDLQAAMHSLQKQSWCFFINPAPALRANTGNFSTNLEMYRFPRCEMR